MARGLKLQPKQRLFSRTKARVALFGGARGGGKSFALQAEPLKYREQRNFHALMLRREKEEVRGIGGIWHEMKDTYRMTGYGGRSNETSMTWQWPSGAAVKCAGLQHESDATKYRGRQFPGLYYDELTAFTYTQFTTMLGSVRSGRWDGIPHVRMTTNPDPGHWVRRLVDPFIGEDGLPNDKCGKLIWVQFHDDGIVHGWTRKEMAEKLSVQPNVIHRKAMTFTFIPSSLSDNAYLMRDDTYVARLEALDDVMKARMLYGDWNAAYAEGGMFKAENFVYLDEVPKNIIRKVRSWDFAATEKKKKGDDPDYSVGTKMGILPDHKIVVLDVERFRAEPAKLEKIVRSCADRDGPDTDIVIEQGPGEAGKNSYYNWSTKVLPDRNCYSVRPTGSKEERARPYSAAVGNGLVYVMSGRPWTDPFIVEHVRFPSSWHDDQVDSGSMGFNYLRERVPVAPPTLRKIGFGKRKEF